MVKSSLKISESSMELLRLAAEANSRSLAGQAEHWMNLGRKLDEAQNQGLHPDVRRALERAVDPDTLPGELQEQFLDELGDLMRVPSAEEEAFFARMREQGGAVGYVSDESDEVVKLAPGGEPMPHELTLVTEPRRVSTLEDEENQLTEHANAYLEAQRHEHGEYFVLDGYVMHRRPTGETVRMNRVGETSRASR